MTRLVLNQKLTSDQPVKTPKLKAEATTLHTHRGAIHTAAGQLTAAHSNPVDRSPASPNVLRLQLMGLPSAQLHKPETRQGASHPPSSSTLNLIQILLPKCVMKQFLPNSIDRSYFQIIIICCLPKRLCVLFVSDFTPMSTLNTATKMTFLNHKSKYSINLLSTLYQLPTSERQSRLLSVVKGLYDLCPILPLLLLSVSSILLTKDICTPNKKSLNKELSYLVPLNMPSFVPFLPPQSPTEHCIHPSN